MTNFKLIEADINRILTFSKNYNSRKGAIRSSSPTGVKILRRLNSLAEKLIDNLEPHYFTSINRQVSKGQSNIPKIVWMSFLPRGRTVSNFHSVTICFGKNGEGIVAGLMAGTFSASTLPGGVEKLDYDDPQVDICGGKAGLNYDKMYITPKEYLKDNIDISDLISHLDMSLKLLQKIML